MPRAATSRAIVFGAALLVCAGNARAEEEIQPVFDGHTDLARYTKEFGVEVTPSLTEDGPAVGAGLTVSSFYARWLASFAGATFSPRWAGPRERWEARGGARLIYPTPLFAGVFGYLVGGGGLLFTAVDGLSDTYHRSLTGIVGLGVFANVSSRVRLRLEFREHLKLYGRSDTSHTETLGVSLVFLAR